MVLLTAAVLSTYCDLPITHPWIGYMVSERYRASASENGSDEDSDNDEDASNTEEAISDFHVVFGSLGRESDLDMISIKSIEPAMDGSFIKIGEITCILTTFNSSGNPHLEGAGSSSVAQDSEVSSPVEEGASGFATFETTDLFKKVVLVPVHLVFSGIARSASGHRIDFSADFDKIRAPSGLRFCADLVTTKSSQERKEEYIISATPPHHSVFAFDPGGAASAISSPPPRRCVFVFDPGGYLRRLPLFSSPRSGFVFYPGGDHGRSLLFSSPPSGCAFDHGGTTNFFDLLSRLDSILQGTKNATVDMVIDGGGIYLGLMTLAEGSNLEGSITLLERLSAEWGGTIRRVVP